MKTGQMKILWRIVILSLTFFVVFATLSISRVNSQAHFFAGGVGIGVDPLTTQEEGVLTAAIQNMLDESELSRADQNERQEILLIERHHESKEKGMTRRGERRGVAYIYSYRDNSLIHAIIHTETGAVEVLERVQGVQFPLTQDEVERALNIVYNNAELRHALETIYQQVHSEPLSSFEQISAKAFIFRADAMPDIVNEDAQRCGLHRCAQLILYMDDTIAFDLSPIVDLSRELVVQTIESP